MAESQGLKADGFILRWLAQLRYFTAGAHALEAPMRQTGTVKFFNHAKGFGFITPDQGDKDLFVHVSALQASGMTGLDEGMRVSFETEPDKRGKGPKAIDLKLAT